MLYNIVTVVIYISCFGISLYALEAVRFEKLCKVNNPTKVTILLFLFSMALGYLIAEFILGITMFMR
ncbi:MAG: DUF1146 domain-containing protein [Erysipelotrichaceae bacterium]